MREHACRAGALAAAALLCLASAALAAPESPPTEAAAQAAAPSGQAATPTVAPFRSTLSGYRSYRADESLRDWRASNDEVGRLRGHGGHLQPRPGGAAR